MEVVEIAQLVALGMFIGDAKDLACVPGVQLSNSDGTYYVSCPHCRGLVLIEQENCKVFRHGIVKSTGIQVASHLPKAECDALVASGNVIGCCGPFELIDRKAVICGYK
jgi:hypothetical protein